MKMSMDRWYERFWQGKTEVIVEKPVLVTNFPPQISQGLAPDPNLWLGRPEANKHGRLKTGNK